MQQQQQPSTPLPPGSPAPTTPAPGSPTLSPSAASNKPKAPRRAAGKPANKFADKPEKVLFCLSIKNPIRRYSPCMSSAMHASMHAA